MATEYGPFSLASDGMNTVAMESNKRRVPTGSLNADVELFDLLLKPSDGIAKDAFKYVTLAEFGLDSLFVIHVRERWRLMFAFEISMLVLLANKSVGELAQKAVCGLQARYRRSDVLWPIL